MQTSAEPRLLDTSTAIALVDPDHIAHNLVRQALKGCRLGLSGHAEVETFSVLTRLPGAKRMSRKAAARLIQVTFPETRHLSADGSAQLVQTLAGIGVGGGAVYDALVAAAAAEHGLTLVSRDTRAAATYRAVGATTELL